MRRYLGLVAAAAALTYFFDPVSGSDRRRRLVEWVRARWERSLADRGADPTTEPPEEVYAAAERLEAAMAAAAATAPAAEAQTEAAGAREPPRRPVDDPTTPRPTITVHELQERPPTSFGDWDLPPPPAPATESGEPNRSARRILAAAAGAALVAVAVAVGLVVWAVWPSSASTVPSVTQAVVDDQARAIALLSQPDVKRIPVLGTQGRLVLVYAKNGNAVLIATKVKRAPAGRTYQTWVIVGKKPQPSGLFAGGDGSIVVPLQHAVPKGATVAVTLEPAGGSLSPMTKPLFSTTRSS
jgi:hypothetical protein